MTVDVAKTEVTAISRLDGHPEPALLISNKASLPVGSEGVRDLGEGDDDGSVLQVLNVCGLDWVVSGVGTLVEGPPSLQ